MKNKPELKVCDLDSVGFEFEGPEADRITEVINEYLGHFFAPTGGCVLCGAQLGGLMGTFTWLITHGEGQCGKCQWPARAIHYIKDTDDTEIFTTAPRWILQYRPSFLNDDFLKSLVALQHFQEDIDRIREIQAFDKKSSIADVLSALKGVVSAYELSRVTSALEQFEAKREESSKHGSKLCDVVINHFKSFAELISDKHDLNLNLTEEMNQMNEISEAIGTAALDSLRLAFIAGYICRMEAKE